MVEACQPTRLGVVSDLVRAAVRLRGLLSSRGPGLECCRRGRKHMRGGHSRPLTAAGICGGASVGSVRGW